MKYLLDRHRSPISGFVLITPRPQFYGKKLLQDEEIWLAVFQNTFTGPLEALKAAIPYLRKPSKIVVVTGLTSVQFLPEAGPACVIRRVWTTYVKALSHQLGVQAISINAVYPAVILTNFHQKRIESTAKENGIDFEAEMDLETASIPLGRHGKP